MVGRRVELRDARVADDLRLKRRCECQGECDGEQGGEAGRSATRSGSEWHGRCVLRGCVLPGRFRRLCLTPQKHCNRYAF